MERSRWMVLCAALAKVTRQFPGLKRARYNDFLVATYYFWGVLHDRPMTWALDPANHTALFRPRRHPSVSQLNRRVASDRFQLLLQRVHARLAGDGRFKGLLLDGQALVVGPVSRDRDARRGHVPGGFGKGYKLHAVVATDGSIPVFAVLPLNAHELPVARAMLATLRHDLAGTLVMADGNYDAAALHKDVGRRGGFLVTRPRGRARHPVTRRQMGRGRRLLVDLWDRCPRLMERVYQYRKAVERRFGNLAAIPGLLGAGLPKSVRGLPRVRRFVGGKICLYHAHRIAKTLDAAGV